MKEKPSEWVSISDLMAGVVAVVMLLLVIAVLQNAQAELQRKKEREQGAAAQRQKAGQLLRGMQVSLAQQGASRLIQFDLEGNRMTLSDSVFARSSACITAQASHALASIEQQLAGFLASSPDARLFVEGHTDSVAVTKEVIDKTHFCTVYDDNYTLSAARAREARKLLVGSMSSGTARNVIVAGYGDSHPLPGIDPEDPRNRRVEVRLVMDGLAR